MRGGLDDALDKLARRDQLRRRAAGEASGTPIEVQELVEAIATVVGRHPNLAVTVGVEGAGDPTLLHFFVEDGVVQVNADNAVAARAAQAEPSGPRHADFDLDPVEAEEPYPAGDQPSASEPRPAAHRPSYDDRDRYDPGTGYGGPGGYEGPDPFPPHDSQHAAPADRSYDGQRRYDEPAADGAEPNPFLHPFAATPPPPVPPQTTHRIRPEQHRAPEEPSAAERESGRSTQPPAAHREPEPQRGMPTPLPEPIPLQVDSKETELAAKRLAALLRDNPSLLRPSATD